MDESSLFSALLAITDKDGVIERLLFRYGDGTEMEFRIAKHKLRQVAAEHGLKVLFAFNVRWAASCDDVPIKEFEQPCPFRSV